MTVEFGSAHGRVVEWDFGDAIAFLDPAFVDMQGSEACLSQPTPATFLFPSSPLHWASMLFTPMRRLFCLPVTCLANAC